mgnify:CR=1 FL=1
MGVLVLGERLRPLQIAAVALANKLARIAYAILTTGQPYRPQLAMAAAG